MSSSPLRFASEIENLAGGKARAEFVCVSAPANCIDLGEDQRFQSVFFYGIHAVEVLLEILGEHVGEVQVSRGKRATTIQIDFLNATGSIQLIRDVDEFYGVHTYSRNGQQDLTISLDGSYYPRLLRFLFEEFYTGSRTVALTSTLQAIEILDKAEQAAIRAET